MYNSCTFVLRIETYVTRPALLRNDAAEETLPNFGRNLVIVALPLILNKDKKAGVYLFFYLLWSLQCRIKELGSVLRHTITD